MISAAETGGRSDAVGPSVSVVIPAHNSGATIGATLASVAAQMLQPSDVVVIDDGSSDDTVAAAEDWSDKLPLRILRGPHAGAAAARHKGITTSACELVALLDADDVWVPDHLSTMVRTWADNPDHLVSAFSLRWVPDAGVWRGAPEPMPSPERQMERILHVNFASGSALFGRKLYEKAGGFRARFTIGEDWDLWIRMVRAGATVIRTDHPTFLYRLTPGSLTGGGRKYVGAEDVLRAAVEEAANGDQRRWAEEGLRQQAAVQRRARAGMALVDAYDAARAGDTSGARRTALQTLHGSLPVVVRGAAVMIWPRGAVRSRDRRYANREQG